MICLILEDIHGLSVGEVFETFQWEVGNKLLLHDTVEGVGLGLSARGIQYRSPGVAGDPASKGPDCRVWHCSPVHSGRGRQTDATERVGSPEYCRVV